LKKRKRELTAKARRSEKSGSRKGKVTNRGVPPLEDGRAEKRLGLKKKQQYRKNREQEKTD